MTSSLFSVMAQSNTGSDWNWLLTFIIFVVVVAVAMIVQAKFSKQEADELTQQLHLDEEPHASNPEVAAEPEVEVSAEPEVAAAPVVSLPPEPDDLKKLEGIGPKVAGLLNQNGITTFAQLADTPVEKLTEILEAAKLQMIHPASWPSQAKLAAAGDWKALQKLQDSLKGGR